LQSQAPEHTFSFTKKQIRNELGASIEEIFETFSTRPIASGSIAQVYKV
jgi:aarF domain-containing kinase